jgi:twinkle protein
LSGAGWIAQASDGLTCWDALERVGMKTSIGSSAGPCPACSAARRGTGDRRGPVGIGADGRAWKCHRCEASGDVIDLVAYTTWSRRFRELSGDERENVRAWFQRAGVIEGHAAPPALRSLGAARTGRTTGATSAGPEGAREATDEARQTSAGSGGPFGWREGLVEAAEAALLSAEGIEVLEYLTKTRRFSLQTVKDWRLGAHLIRDERGEVVERWVTIPLRDDSGRVETVRFRSVPGPCLRCAGSGCGACKDSGTVKKAYRVCTGRPLPLFGAHHLSADRQIPVIITEGELDVIALYEYGVRVNCVSGTAGASANWPAEWLDLLEPYSSFLLAYDDDDAGNSGAEKLAETLGRYRCSRVRFTRNDVGDCLAAGDSAAEIERALARAEPALAIKFRRPGGWGAEIEDLIRYPDRLRGRPTGSAKLDAAIGGLPNGLIVVTGDTGHGKTTWATWLLREQARAGVPVLVTSFEQRPIGTVQKLLRAEVGGDFTKVTERQREEALARLDLLPIFLLDHYGETTFEQVRDAIRYARRRYGCRTVLVDHLGFLVRDAGDQERQKIEEVVRALALIGVNDEVSILLICHPNRMSKSQQRRIQIGDLKGASAIEQDSHLGLVVERLDPSSERGWPAAMVHVDKVRSEFGSPGAKVLMPFDPLSCVYGDRWEDTPSGRAGLRVCVPG